MSETKDQIERGAGSIQREASSREVEATKIRREIKAIREGHGTGGYCETEKLHEAEKRLWKILSAQLEEAKRQHGYSPDPKYKHAEVRRLELEVNGLSWKPKLLVSAEN